MKPRLSNWKEESDLFEVITGKMTDEKALKKVSEKKGINNKVTINPKLFEAMEELGGEVISVDEALAPSKQELNIMKKVNRLQLRLQKEKKKTTQKAEQSAKQQDDVAVQQEEVGVSSSARMKEAQKEAALRAKEEAAVKKEKKALNKESASYETVKKGEVLGALKRDNKGRKKPLSVADRDKIADKVVKDKGDTSKSDDRYAYEAYEKLPRVKVLRKAGTLSRHGDEAEKKRSVKMVKTLDTHRPQDSRLKAAVNRRKSAPKLEGFEFVKKLVREDEAYKKTVADLKAKFGTGVLASKQDFEDHKKREAAKPKPKVEPQKPLTDAEKAQKEVDAQYGGAENRKKGYGLGT